MLNTVKLLNYVDCEGENPRDTYYLYKLLGACKGYIRWTLINEAQPGDVNYEKFIDDCIESKEYKLNKLNTMANAVVRAAIKLRILEDFLKRDGDYNFIRRHECAEEAIQICEAYSISLNRNFYEKAKSLES